MFQSSWSLRKSKTSRLRGRVRAMGMRPGRRPLWGSMCSTQIGFRLGLLLANSCTQFSVLPARRPDWGAYPWHTLCREDWGFGSLRVLGCLLYGFIYHLRL
jgi:hypothetical protein